jgi:hypothetical protein
MYHEVTQPYGLLWNLRRVLRPGGHVAVIDARRVTALHGTPPNLLRCELAAVGYRQTAFYDRRTTPIWPSSRPPVRQTAWHRRARSNPVRPVAADPLIPGLLRRSLAEAFGAFANPLRPGRLTGKSTPMSGRRLLKSRLRRSDHPQYPCG